MNGVGHVRRQTVRIGKHAVLLILRETKGQSDSFKDARQKCRLGPCGAETSHLFVIKKCDAWDCYRLFSGRFVPALGRTTEETF